MSDHEIRYGEYHEHRDHEQREYDGRVNDQSTFSFRPKDPTTSENFFFDFTKDGPGNLISATVTCAAIHGVDANASAMVSGTAIPDGYKIKQLITNGVLGVTYLLVCVVVDSNGNHFYRVGSVLIQVEA